ncbi:hypothetical protein VPNG_03674 [Cytospora leucostoma]|uniref:Peptidase C15, pyroglutamyl peptidase I-like protein n=1 Tax=Cytospora leucostoma TaxID=1230097 RepID=A0A423XFJ4_9PEZI|nr:hypothetical protein VPNG_03674 [Cytospora leucostoma]
MGGGPVPPSGSAAVVTSLPDKGEQVHRSKSSTQSDGYTVLVTGMGPFPDGEGGRYEEDDNTSHLITQYLPGSLPASHPLNPTQLPICILNPTAPAGCYVKTEYGYIRSFVQRLYDEFTDPGTGVCTLDAVVHLGMADGFRAYTVEERAFNQRMSSNWWSDQLGQNTRYYLIPDDAGRTVEDITEDEGKDLWRDAPTGLAAEVDVSRVANDAVRAVNSLGEEKKVVSIVPHFEAGPFGCGFIYYESLATCRKRKLGTKVVFSHVPSWKDEPSLQRGAEAICAIIGAVCKQVESD